MTTIRFYAAVVLAIAIPLALFEIWLERFKTGWGGNFRPGSFWGKKLRVPVLYAVVGDLMVTPYHLITFLAVVPMLYGIAIYLATPHTIHGIAAWLVFLIACQLGIMVVEDVLWFTFNTIFRLRFPDALPRLLRGEATWHPRWINFGVVKLPDFYIYLPIAIAGLLTIEHFVSR